MNTTNEKVNSVTKPPVGAFPEARDAVRVVLASLAPDARDAMLSHLVDFWRHVLALAASVPEDRPRAMHEAELAQDRGSTLSPVVFPMLVAAWWSPGANDALISAERRHGDEMAGWLIDEAMHAVEDLGALAEEFRRPRPQRQRAARSNLRTVDFAPKAGAA